MRKLSALAAAAVFAALSFTAMAGVAPTTGASQMGQSGAKIAAPKPATTEEKKENQEEPKEQAK